MQHWSFWLGGIALGATALVYVALVGRALGVSGAVGGVVRGPGDDSDAAVDACDVGPRSPLSFVEQVAFLASIAGGAALSALLAGTWGRSASAGLSDGFVARFGNGTLSWALVLGGGVLVGVGTQWARGCTSGHGLMGTAALQRPSLLATAVFFGTAIAVSLVVDAVVVRS